MSFSDDALQAIRQANSDYDRNARVQKIAEEDGLPADLVDRNLDRIEKDRKQYDFRNSPKTAEFFTAQRNADVSGDDAEKLAEMERILRSHDEPGAIEHYAKVFADAATNLGTGAIRFAGTFLEADRKRAIEGYLGKQALEQIEKQTKEREAKGEWVDPLEHWKSAENRYDFKEKVVTPEDIKGLFSEGEYMEGVSSVGTFIAEQGVASVPQMLTYTTPAGVYTSLMSNTQQLAEEVAKNKGEELSDKHLAMAAPWSIASILLDKYGAELMVKAGKSEAELLKEMAGDLASITARKAFVSAGKEGLKAGAGEAGTEFAQGIIEYVGARFGTEAKIDMADAIEQGAWGALAGGPMGVAVGTPAAYLNEREQIIRMKRDQEAMKDFESLRDQDLLDNVIDKSQSFATTKRAPEVVEQFFQSVAGEKQVFISQDAVIDAMKAGKDLPVVLTEKIDPSGRDIVLPMSEFVTKIAPRVDLVESFRPFMKIREDGVTIKEMEERRGRPTLQAMLGKADRLTRIQKENEEALQEFEDAIVSTGKVGRRAAKSYVEMQAQFADRVVEDYKKQGINLEIKDVLKRARISFAPSTADMGPRWAFENSAKEMVRAGKISKEDFEALPEPDQKEMVARYNAAKPVESGGLGLPENNTREDRAKAMGKELKEGEVYDPIVSAKPEGMRQDTLPEKIVIDGVERHTRNSNGQQIATNEEGVRNFYKWFGASKVVDAEGRPLVVYHGTGRSIGNRGELMSGKFDTFRADFSGKSSKTGAPEGSFFFTDNEDVASSYTVKWQGDFSTVYKEEANVMPVYLRIEKAESVNAKGVLWREILYKKEFLDINEIVDSVKKIGKKDGVIVKNVLDRGVGSVASNIPSTTLVVFSPTQIKSVANVGSFSRETGNIYYQKSESGFFSQLQKAAEELKQEKGTPDQMLAMLKKAGAKDAEIEAVGLKEYLDLMARPDPDGVDYVHDYYGDAGARPTAHAAKQGDKTAIKRMAQAMAEKIPAGATLVPVPSRTGKATMTLDLAKEIAKITGSEVADVLTGVERESLYDIKKSGRKASMADLGFRTSGKAVSNPVLIDNVFATGLTFDAAKAALPEARMVAYARDTTAMPHKPATITKAQIVEFVSNNGVQVETTVLGAESEAKEEGFSVIDDDGRRMASFETEEEADDYASENGGFVEPSARQQARESRARNTNYTLPGGENHVELVLSIPNIEGWNQGDTTHYGDIADGKAVAWVRANDRTDADGKKVLFIEEIQSKRAQEGRSKGFAGKKLPKGWRIEKNGSGEFAVFDSDGSGVSRWRRSELYAIEEAMGLRIPPAPFVEKTDAWVSLAMKRMITYAVENGYDRVAWTTGEQQADRYALSKQIGEIHAIKQDDGKYKILGYKDAGHRGRGRRRPLIEKEGLNKDEVSELIGKEFANKIEEDLQGGGEKVYSGTDLNIGGEGMKSFYDKIIPSVAKEVTKKMDGKVVNIRLQPPKRTVQSNRDDEILADLGIVVEGKFTGIQLGFDITDKMREQVQGQGLPLFQNKPDPLGATYQMPLGDRVIKLFEKSNPSTLFHEMSHLWLLMEADLSREFGITPLQRDMLKWLGVESFDDITTAHHERFARTFEAYLFEGKAPSLALADVMRQVKEWMIRVYEFVTKIPDAKIDDDIRSIFDRMLATEQKMEEVRANPAYDQYFHSKEEAGWSNEDWFKYMQRSARRDAKAKETVDEKLLKEWKRYKAKEWIAERDALAETEEAVLKGSPVYKAVAALKSGKLDRDQVADAMDVDLKAKKEDATEEEKKILNGLKRISVQDGLQVEQFAKDTGFSSGRAMIEAVLAAEPIAKQAKANADQMMKDKYGDSLNEQTLEAELKEAINSEEEAEILLMEIRALDKKARRSTIDKDYVIKQARDLIATMRKKDMRPNDYYRQMVKAAENSKKVNAEAAKINAAIEKEREKVAEEVAEQVSKEAYNALKANESAEKELRKTTESEKSIKDEIDFKKLEVKEAEREAKEKRKKSEALVKSLKKEKKILADKKKKGKEPENYEVSNYELLKDTVKNAEAEAKAAEKELAKLEKELAKLTSDYAVAVDRRNSADADLEAAKKEVDAQIEKAGEKADKLKAARARTSAAVRELEKKLSEVSEKASAYKRQQLANHYLFRESTEAKKKIDIHTRYIKKVQVKEYNPKEIDPEYIKQMKRLAMLFTMKHVKVNMTPEEKAEHQRQMDQDLRELLTWYETQVMSDQYLAELMKDDAWDGSINTLQWLSDDLIKALEAKKVADKSGSPFTFKLTNIEDMTAGQIQGLYDTLKHISSVGRRKSEYEKNERKRVQEEMGNFIASEHGKPLPRNMEPTIAEGTKRRLKELWYSHRNLYGIFMTLSGGGKDKRLMAYFEKMLDAVNYHITLEQDFAKEINKIMGPILLKMASRSEVTITKEDGESWSLSKQARFVLALNMGNQSNIDAVLDGMNNNYDGKFTENDLIAMISGMSKEELNAVNQIWAYKDEKIWPLASAVNRKVTGVSAAKLEPRPMVVNGVQLTGGHYRLHYKPGDGESKAKDFGEEPHRTQMINMGKNASQIERVGGGGREVDLGSLHLYRDIDEELRFIAFKEVSMEMSSLLRGKKNPVRAAIVRHYGPEYMQNLETLVDQIVNVPVVKTGLWQSLSRYIRSNMVYAFLAFSIRNTVQAVSGFANAASQLGEGRMVMSILRFYTSPMQNFEEVHKSSAFMRDRIRLVNNEAMTELSRLSIWSPLTTPIKKVGFSMQAAVDGMMSYPFWMEAKRKYLDENPVSRDTNFKAREKAANDYADMMVKQIMGSGHPLDVGSAFSSPDELQKNFVFMGTFVNTIYNANAHNVQLFKSGQIEWYELVRRMGWYTVLSPMLVMGVLGQIPDTEDDEFWEEIAKGVLGYNAAQIIGLNHVYNYMATNREFTLPVVASGKAVSDLAKQVYHGVMDEEEMEWDAAAEARLIRQLSLTFPFYGASQMARIIEGADDDEQNFWGMLVEGKQR